MKPREITEEVEEDKSSKRMQIKHRQVGLISLEVMMSQLILEHANDHGQRAADVGPNSSIPETDGRTDEATDGGGVVAPSAGGPCEGAT